MRAPLVAMLLASLPRAVSGSECSPDGEVLVHGLGTFDDEAARLAELSGAVALAPRLIRRGGSRTEIACAGADFPWRGLRAARDPGSGDGLRVDRLPLALVSAWNSTYPSGQNDGLLWAGRGLSQELSGGVLLRRGILSAAIAPEVTWSENAAFPLVPTGRPGELRYANPYYGNGIDYPQAFGSGPWAAWAPGQSYVRADAWNVGAGLSSESLWFGPGVRSSILMSNAGPGFPHAFVGTSRPANVGIGRAEALLFWGRLSRTRFIEGGGHPLVEGLVLDYAPRWVPGLSVGLARVFVKPWDGLAFHDYLAMFQGFEKRALATASNPTGDNPLDNQIASLFARWVFPEVGLDLYGEWAREDYNWTWWGTLREPGHSQAWLLGLQKAFRSGARVVRFHAEILHLQDVVPPASHGGMPVYYVHGNDLGYTNAGQLLGAWAGPGGDVQHVAVDVFHRGGRIGGHLERVARNEAYYWTVIEPVQGSFSHDAEVTAAVRQVLYAGPLELSWEAAASYRQNRDWIAHEKNLRLGLSVALRP